MTPRTRAAAVLAAALLCSAGFAADKRPMKVDDLFAFKRVAAPRISPDGKRVAYHVSTVDLEKNKSSAVLWVAATDGKSPPKQLTKSEGKKDTAPQWSPDGKHILFESNRSGSGQLWVVPADGGAEPKQVTSISTGASNGVWSPDGKSIAFSSAVYPEFSEKPFADSDKANKAKDDEIEKSPVKAKTFTKLFYRHWDDYVGDKRQHLFVCDIDGKNCRDVTPGDRDAYPTSTTFSSGDDHCFTPDSKHLVFTAVPEKDEAWSTNYDICRVSVTNTSPKWDCLTAANKAADSGPKFSPDGKTLAWRAQRKAGYEADKWLVKTVKVKPDGSFDGKPSSHTPRYDDVSASEFAWVAPTWIQFAADKDGGVWSYIIAVQENGDSISDLNQNNPTFRGQVSALSGTGREGAQVAFLMSRMDRPADVYTLDPNNRPVNLSKANDDLLGRLDLPRPESVKVKIEDGTMQMWVLKPPGFDEKKKWPVVYLIHGGPQGAWEDGWSFRWNAQVWAAQGYVVVMPNPRGSTGFGQKFSDEITGDWGGKCYRDLVAGIEYVEKLPYADANRMATAGASFGGYMQNWFAVNDIAKKFKCQINHCSVWNFESMWGTTDELWFDEWEHGGVPWEQPAKYAEFSPHKKAGNLGKYKVPMLIIHNDLDFRCPIGQGHELFSALQRQGVPSRFLNFPDEGHWVTKPQNSRHWHKEVFGWLTKYAPPGGK